MSPPRPLYARCGPPPVHSLHAFYACGAQRALRHDPMNIHDPEAVARSRRWSRRYTSCSDLNSQPKRPGDLDLCLLTLKVVKESRVTRATSVPILVFLGLCSRLRPDVRDRRQTDVRQTDVRQKHRLMPRLFGAGA